MTQPVGAGAGAPKKGPVVAIDGPAGTGKSSVTKRLAEALQFTHVDTGALYRAIGYLTLKEASSRYGSGESGFSPEEERQTAGRIARETALEFRHRALKNPTNRLYASGKDVTEFIRTPEVSMAASRVAGHAEVRDALRGLQRKLGAEGRTLLEGRDIGTVIFPDAEVKFFLTARVEERAKRRLAELEASGADPMPSFEDLKRQIQERDTADSTRAVAPLRRAPDAIEVDTSDLTLDQVVARLVAEVRARIGA